MAVVLKQVTVSEFFDVDGGTYTNNSCQDCTVCNWLIVASGFKTTPTTNYVAYQGTIDHVCEASIRAVQLTWDSFIVKNRFVVYADGSIIYDTGCTTGSGSPTFNVPANTKKLDVLVYGRCDGIGSDDQWNVSLGCI